MKFRQKDGKQGAAVRYMTRTQAVRKLQISLKDFRRLCILKGIYPRDPKKKAFGKSKTYYYTKDILFLAHEPLLHKFREFKTFVKRVKKARGRKEYSEADRLEANKPTYTLEHIVRERYPRFADALRDLDDGLCLLHLFASLPATARIPAKRIANCARLCAEFHQYLAASHAVRKSFVSIKGIYMQAEVCGETVTWVQPHQFTQNLPDDVDYRVMLTFLEFYECVQSFVNLKLFAEIGRPYPPSNPEDVEAEGMLNFAWMAEEKRSNGAAEDEEEEEWDADAADLQSITNPEISALRSKLQRQRSLFAGMRVFLGREVPRRPLQLLLVSFGAEVGWDGEKSPFAESDEKITHHIVDREWPDSKKKPMREYLQPQWVFDCVNFAFRLPVDRYLSSVTSLPPHLSPFVDPTTEGGYLTPYAKEVQELIGEREREREREREIAGEGEREIAGEGEEERELRKMMMRRKDRKLYDRMQFGIMRKTEKGERLEMRRQALEGERESEGERERESEGEREREEKPEGEKKKKKRSKAEREAEEERVVSEEPSKKKVKKGKKKSTK